MSREEASERDCGNKEGCGVWGATGEMAGTIFVLLSGCEGATRVIAEQSQQHQHKDSMILQL